MEAKAKSPQIFRRQIQMHSLEWKYINFDQIFSEVCPKGPINNIPALAHILAWHRPGDKRLSEPIVAYFDVANMRHSASMD